MRTREFIFLLGTLLICLCSAEYEAEGGYEQPKEEPTEPPYEEPEEEPYESKDTEKGSYAENSYSSSSNMDKGSFAMSSFSSSASGSSASGSSASGSSASDSSASSSNMGKTFSASDIDRLNVEGGAVNDPGMDATSKACRYDEGVGWSDCDPFELIKFRVLRLVHGGSQCEEMKNITKHCTPHDFPYGTHWLIQEHRKCISELNRLKAMIADLHKFIEVMHEKGKELFSAYTKLKDKLSELTERLDKLKVEGIHQKQVLEKLKSEIEEWKTKARELQVELDDLRAKFHDLQAEQHEISLRNEQLTSEINVIAKENEGIKMKISQMTRENEELKRRIVESERNKEQVADLKLKRDQLAVKLDKLMETLQITKDKLAEVKIQILAKKLEGGEEDLETKDTHVDLNLEMFITHNSTRISDRPNDVYYTTEGYEKEYVEESAKCLISYYGTTNETCWYESEGEESEDAYVDALGHHLVEAHWKYFTIDVKDQAECDKAAHLHYEFLLNRCQPKHYLPVLAVFRGSSSDKELTSHIYPKVDAHGTNACWITFLGAHGHCEAHSNKYDLYNTPDNEEPSSHQSKDACLDRAQWWMKYCDTPVIVTYVPEDVSTNWHEDWIMHDSHGGRMFEESYNTKNKINPDSLKPHTVDASKYKSEYKSMAPKSPDYHDSPEYRKSLHLQGQEKEEMLASLRRRLGMSGPAGRVSEDVKQHFGVDTNAELGKESSMSSMSSSSSSFGMSSRSSDMSSSSSSDMSSYSQSSYSNNEEHPAENPYPEKPAENSYEEKPAENPYGEKPAEQPYEEKPAEQPYEEKPAETPYEEKPAENPYEQKPYEEKPAETPYEEKPAETPYEEKPEETPNEEKPAENPYEEKPEEKPYEEKPAENPYEEKPEEKPYEEKEEEEPYGEEKEEVEEGGNEEEPYSDAPKYDEPEKDESAEKYK